MFVELPAHVQGQQQTDIDQTLSRLGGADAPAKVSAAIQKLFDKSGTDFSSQVEPWLGQKLGIVLTQLPNGSNPSAAGIAIVAPTSDPSAARAFIQADAKRLEGLGDSATVVGHYAIVGGALAYPATVAAASGSGASLADDNYYRTAVSTVGGDPDASMWVNAPAIERVLTSSATGGSALGAQLEKELGKVPAGSGEYLALTLTPTAMRLDTYAGGLASRTGAAAGSAPDAGALPANSWLALSTGSRGLGPSLQRNFASGFRIGMASEASELGASPLAARQLQMLTSVLQQVGMALGPFSLSLGGTSPLAITAGFEMKSPDAKAAGGLVAELESLVSRSAHVTGNSKAFSIRLPTGQSVSLTNAAGKIVAIYGFASQRAFLDPTSTLAGTSLYRQAVSQLNSGSSVPLFVSFAPIAALVELGDHQSSAAKTVAVLRKLSYLIVGTHAHEEQVVLGFS